MILRKIIPLFLILFLLTGSKRPTASENPGKYLPDQLLVKFKPQISKEEIDNINKKFGCKVIKYISDQRLYLIELPKGASVREMIDSYQQIPEVDYAEPNYLIKLP